MKLGTNDIGSVYLGTNAVQKVYLGTNEVWTSFTGLLDTYTGAAAAYSLRRLSGSYSGSAIRVRIDTTGNPEYNIGFVNNELDVATLEGYCTGGLNAFVKTWYDQSGNGYDAEQTTLANQPQIVSSGSVILENGKPTIYFDGTQWLNTASALTAQNGFVFAVYNSKNGQFSLAQADPTQVTNSIRLDDNGTTSSPKYIRFLNLLSGGGNILVGNSDIYDAQTLATYSSNGSAWAAWVNGLSQTLTSVVGSNTGNWFGDYQFPLYIQRLNRSTPFNTLSYNQEIVIYGSDQSSNRTGIETNINTYYSIY